MILYCSSQLVFEGSADSQVFVIDPNNSQKFIISFTGFLNKTDDTLDKFRCSEITVYDGASVNQIRETSLSRSKDNKVNENHSFRRFNLTPELKAMVFDWMFEQAEDVEYFN